MSINFDIIIYPRKNVFCGASTFKKLIEVFEDSSSVPVTNEWCGLKVKSNKLNNYEYYSHDRIKLKEIITFLAKPTQKKTRTFKVSNALLNCRYSHDTGTMKENISAVDISAWDSEGSCFDSSFYGYAKITVFRANNFFTLIESETGELDKNKKEYNEGILNNLESIRNLVNLIIEHIDPLSIKVFMDTGWQVPFNSHCTYFANTEAFLGDLLLLQELYNGKRLIRSDEPPFSEYDESVHSFAFNEMRSKEQRKELWNELNLLLQVLPYVTSDIVESTWNASRPQEGMEVSRTKGGGALVYGSRDFFNSFVDHIYVEALEIAYLTEEEKDPDFLEGLD